jgi:hypothetical protein
LCISKSTINTRCVVYMQRTSELRVALTEGRAKPRGKNDMLRTTEVEA